MPGDRIRIVTGKAPEKILSKMIDRKINRKLNAKTQTKEKLITQTSTIVTADTGIILSLMDLDDGIENGQRIGLEVFPTSIEFNYEFIVQTADVTNIVRLVLIHWKDETSDNPPTLAKIFQDTVFVRPLSPFNFANKGSARSFTVLYDRILTLNIHGLDNKSGKVKLFGRKLPNNIHFNDASTTEAQGKVFMVVWSDSAANGPKFKMNGVFKYKNS